ncbi:small hydrophobic protein [Streptomyces sp. CB02923]|uniref:small hydrophobic protein n=1 Tax=Streptomyces sp. CB02923 TaxID=1718985 RepID=UPI00093D2305|nr:small hydrophobic protein [Streptomyces sp. CB02923]OKI04898.1 small hydrophobic protein [Streptomyces sp. CB02923]
MMAGLGQHTRTRWRTHLRGSPRSRGRTGSRTGPDRATLGVIGLICAVAGFFILSLVLGPVSVLLGWLAMGRRWSNGSQALPALVAVVLGVIDTVLAIIRITTTAVGAPF